MTNSELLLELLLQLTVILSVCRLVSYIGKRYFGQTDVVGEMLAGIMLGPSLFGMIAPELQQWLFPKTPVIVGVTHLLPNPSMSILYAMSQIGLMIYMFLVGLELNTDLLRNRARSAGLVSIAGIITPFILGSISVWH
ncbi:MAG: cation:proton antiporter [Pseudanabaena sp.]|jgi:Kef-type K+ transport system membrane component KefB